MKKIDRIFGDVWQFLKRLHIVDKKGKLIKLKINKEQRQIIEALEAGLNVVVAKPRQIGSSTIVTAYLFWKAYTSKDPISCVSILHKMDSANEMFLKHKNYYFTLPSLLQKNIDKLTASSMRFDSGASLNAVTAGGEGGLRSFTISLLHISELCFYADPDELLSTALSALNGNQVIIESTAKAFGDPMHQLIERMQRGELSGKWKLLFFPWFEHDGYEQQVPDGFQLTIQERELQLKYNLTLEQLSWRRDKISEMGLVKFLTEYPGCLEDVFSQKGDCYYSQEDFNAVETIPAQPTDEWYIAQPIPNAVYAIGVDVASGVGKDYSDITVLDQQTHLPVYRFRSNKIAPTMLAEKISHISTMYNKAKTLVESNNWGNAVLLQLEHLNFNSFWKQDGKHWVTDVKSKMKMHEDLKAAIRKGELPKLDEITVCELKSLVVLKEDLAPVSLRTKTGHGDAVISLGLAWQCLMSLPTKSQSSSFNKFFNPVKSNPSNLNIRR